MTDSLLSQCGSEPWLVSVIYSNSGHSDKQIVILEIVGLGSGIIVQDAMRDEVMVAPPTTTGVRTGHHTVTNVALFPVKHNGLGEVGGVLYLVENLDGDFSSEWPGQVRVGEAFHQSYIDRDVAPFTLSISISINTEAQPVPTTVGEELGTVPTLVFGFFHIELAQFKHNRRYHYNCLQPLYPVCSQLQVILCVVKAVFLCLLMSHPRRAPNVRVGTFYDLLWTQQKVRV